MPFDFSVLDVLIASLAAIGAMASFVGVAWLADRLLSLHDRANRR